VAVARAIVVEPDVLLMDEPLSNLDALLRVKMRSELKKLQRRIKVTTIYVTHDQVEAMTMGDRIAVLNKGRLMQVGTPYEVYHHPANLFVAGFVGTPQMNFIEATVSESEGGIVLDAGDFRVGTTPSQSALLRSYIGKTVIMGVRPEHIYPVDRVAGKGVFQEVSGVVDFVERLGSDTIIHLNTGRNIIVVKVSGVYNTDIGDKLRVVIDVEKIHVFRKGDGKAVF